MTPNTVFFLSSAGLLLSFAMIAGGVRLMWLGKKKPAGHPFLALGLMVFICSLMPFAAVEGLEHRHPGEGALAYLTYTQKERSALRQEKALLARIQPDMHFYSLVCPGPHTLADSALLQDWNRYFASFLTPAPWGAHCYTSKRHPPDPSEFKKRI